jgi:hypothetical protein
MNHHPRRLLAGAALALTAGCPLPVPNASAAPFAGSYRGVVVHFAVQGSDRAWYAVDIQATQSVTPIPREQNLYVTITRCVGASSRCVTIQRSRRALADGDVSISPDMSRATVTTTITGIRFHLDAAVTYVDPATRTVVNPGVTVYTLETASGGPNPRAEVNVDTVADVSLGAVSCGYVRAHVFTFQGVDQTGLAARDPRTGTPSIPAAISRTKVKHCR